MNRDAARLSARIGAIRDELAAGLGNAARLAAQAAAREAARLAPVDTGALRSGIGSEDMGGGYAAVISAAPHSAMVEYGTSRTPPRPFMQPAAQAVRSEYIRMAAEAAREVLK